MDPARVASIRKSLESKPTEELRRAFDNANAGTSAEEREALRQLLGERQLQGARPTLALATALLLGRGPRPWPGGRAPPGGPSPWPAWAWRFWGFCPGTCPT